MKTPAALLLAVAFGTALAACAPASISQSRFARPLFNTTTVGGVGYPIIVEGAESIGLNPVVIAQNLRFPAGLGAGSSFRAITRAEAPPTHAHIYIQPGRPLAPSTLTFVHGAKRIGVGTFSIAPAAYGDPQALGSVSAILISDMLNEAESHTRDTPFWLLRRF